MARQAAILGALLVVAAASCRPPPRRCQPGEPCPKLRFSELMAKNDSAWLDDAGETEDWIELQNTGSAALNLSAYDLVEGNETSHRLPDHELGPGEVVVLWADDEPDQGDYHLELKLSARSEELKLVGTDGGLEDEISYRDLGINEALARFGDAASTFEKCLWATPGRPNGDACEPPPPAELPLGHDFPDFEWSEPWPGSSLPLTVSEIAVRPARFVEIQNTSGSDIDLSNFQLDVAPHRPGEPWPEGSNVIALPWIAERLAAGARIAVPVSEADVQSLADNDYEGVVTLRDLQAGEVVDRIDFMAWPEGASLSRRPDNGERFAFCTKASPGISNTLCEPLAERPIEDRARHLYTPGDFRALSQGGLDAGIASVKFLIDIDAGDVAHLLRAEDWELHYTFVREVIDGQRSLDRCNADDAALFQAGWEQFSVNQYDIAEGRRFLMGTLVHHVGPNVFTVELATGDKISPGQILQTFFTAMEHVQTPSRWYLRPRSPIQLGKMQQIQGAAPIVDTNSVFRGVRFQLLTEGVAYGELQFHPAKALEHASLGPRIIAITDSVPNDLPLVGGLITQTLQTPLAHVNVLSRNRGTPNLAWTRVLEDSGVKKLLNTLVRLEVTPTDFSITPADPQEARAFWEKKHGKGPLLVPRLDESRRGILPLDIRTLFDSPVLGAKAAQLAELGAVYSSRAACQGLISVPPNAAGIAVVHSLEHYKASGAAKLLKKLRQEAAFRDDPEHRDRALAKVRKLIRKHPVDPHILTLVESYVEAMFGENRVRFRSSSNAEDLPTFNGAGLYTSISAQLGDKNRTVEDAMRTVWASLYSARAYDERRLANVDEDSVAMGILVHGAFLSEDANGVAITRNIAAPLRGDEYSFNVQRGEASVVNPAPGISTDQITYRWWRIPRLVYATRSNLPGEGPVLTPEEAELLACQARAIHDHFRPLIDPEGKNRWFAIDTEFKLDNETRALVFKQARPYSFGTADVPTDCREF